MAIPVTVLDARRQLRLNDDDTSMDGLIAGWIADAAGWVERYTGHILVARDVMEQFDGFARLRLRAWPIKPDAAVTLSYGDAGATPTTITGARLLAASRPAAILPPASLAWPRLVGGTPVTVTVRAGYEASDNVPGDLRRAMLVLIAAYDQDREGGEVFAKAEEAAKSLCRDYRARGL